LNDGGAFQDMNVWCGTLIGGATRWNAMQRAPGVYNERILVTMDYVLHQVPCHCLLLGWRIPIPGSRNPPESTRIRPSTESVRIRHPF